MQKKDILGDGWLGERFPHSHAMKKLDGEYEGYSAIYSFLPGTKEIFVVDSGEKQCLSGNGYKWITYLPTNEFWALLTFYDPQGELIRWYFDISKKNYIDENGMPCRDDIFLDLIILPDGRSITKDADDLQEALDKGAISIDDYNQAYKTHDQILSSKWSDVDFLMSLSETLLSDYI